jgi:hypothetical protein
MKKIAALCVVTMLALTTSVAVATDLMADQVTPVGSVTVDNDAGNLYVTFDTTGGDWSLTEIHVAVGSVVADIPQKNGNPIPGKFDYKDELETPVQTYTCTIPLDGLSTSGVIAAHAVVEMPLLDENGDPLVDENGEPLYLEETAWGAGTGFDGANWATYFTYTIM